MSRDDFHMGGAFARTARQLGNTTGTAAGTGDNTQANGAWVSRKGTKGIALSAKLVINWTATLAANKTFALAVQMQDAVDNSGTGAANYDVAVPLTVVATDSGAGSTLTGTTEIDVDLGGAREFIRAQVTGDLNASGTDTFAYSAELIFFGDHREPTTNAIATLGTADAI